MENCHKNNWFTNHVVVPMRGGRNELHGYLYCYPTAFAAPQNAHLIQSDTLTATHHDIKIQYYIGNVIPHKNCPETPEEHQKVIAKLDSLFDLSRKRVDSPLHTAKIKYICRNPDDLTILVLAETATQLLLYGVLLSEIPKDGDLREVFMELVCPKSQRQKYEPILWAMSTNFGQFF
jgi:hypothetical protein